MARSFTASTKAWSDKARRNVDLVVKQSIQDVGREMINPKDGIVRGAPFEEGVLPVDEGELLASAVIQIGGSEVGRGSASGPPDFAAAIAGLEMGQSTLIAVTAPHARAIEYGRGALPGRFFTRNAVQQWNAIVQANAQKLKD